jgi:hypothetical protein
MIPRFVQIAAVLLTIYVAEEIIGPFLRGLFTRKVYGPADGRAGVWALRFDRLVAAALVIALLFWWQN